MCALKDAGFDVAVIAPEDDASFKLADYGVAFHPITMSQYGMNPIDEMRYIIDVARIFKEIKPLASLHYTVKPNTFGTLAAVHANVPVLNNIAGAGRSFSQGSLLMRELYVLLHKVSLRKSHTVFFQNNDDMVNFKTRGLVTPDQCIRIPGSGVDLVKHQMMPLPTDGTVSFLFVGRMLEEKGVGHFLEAATLLLDDPLSVKHVRFDLVGEIKDQKGYFDRRKLERMCQHPQINYHGSIDPAFMPEVFRRASCVVLPSHYGEGVPRVLLEACASGRPIITTDNVGCRDVVEPGKNGWMVPPRDSRALAMAMKKFIEADEATANALAIAARRTAESRFDEQIVLGKYFERIQGAINC